MAVDQARELRRLGDAERHEHDARAAMRAQERLRGAAQPGVGGEDVDQLELDPFHRTGLFMRLAPSITIAPGPHTPAQASGAGLARP